MARGWDNAVSVGAWSRVVDLTREYQQDDEMDADEYADRVQSIVWETEGDF